MFRSSVFVICLVSALAFNLVECSNYALGSKVEFNFVQNLTDFLAAYPGIQLKRLARKVSYNGPTARTQLTHRMGNRISGDRLLATDSASQQWGRPQDVRLNLNYPKSGGFGEVITYLEVITEQSSNLGSAYIVSGGVGTRRISVVIEAKQTLYWQYRASIFGY
ncbi:uncharacterized protein LOC129566440 [Sitodiplosis mosellana]|uniref:uncharacterized protein LOC129566440 n=1 Tax=Sitodiplosis mosellana TaxID=263140 RepID=UPI0024438F12|nr:uncharacterized protein LOC129566440 [Sitodiplosis mosellana]